MALHTELQIHVDATRLLALIADVQAVTPRCFRGFSNRIADECVEVLVAIHKANAVQGEIRAAHCDRLLERNDLVAVMLRVAYLKKWIGKPLWSQTLQLTGSIGRQGGGWRASALRTAPAA